MNEHSSLLRIEEMSLNGWPALQTTLYDGWLLRFAEGYTKRSNSISPIFGHGIGLDEKIRRCERIYEQQGLRTIFKITPFVHPVDLDDQLDSLGYGKVDHSLVKTVSLVDVPSPTSEDISLEYELTEVWLDVVAAFNGLTAKQKKITRSLLEQQPLSKAFAVLWSEGKPVACGAAVIEDGWVGLYDIVTDESKRGKGYGEQLVLHLLQWARRQGATSGYLLVVKNNAAANRLYDKIGYVLQYEYWYRVKLD